MKNLPKGLLGEKLAGQHLRAKGYKIIDRNFRIRGGEIDLIALYRNILVFVEVKTRWSKRHGMPEEAITPWKCRALVRTAAYYAATHTGLPEQHRLDVIAVELDASGKLLDIRHTENITG